MGIADSIRKHSGRLLSCQAARNRFFMGAPAAWRLATLYNQSSNGEMCAKALAHSPPLCSLLGQHGVKWLCLFCWQQQVLRTHGTIAIVRTQPFGQKVR